MSARGVKVGGGIQRGTPEKIELRFGEYAPFVVQEIGGEWYVFPEANTDDGVAFWGALIAGAPSRTEALRRFHGVK